MPKRRIVRFIEGLMIELAKNYMSYFFTIYFNELMTTLKQKSNSNKNSTKKSYKIKQKRIIKESKNRIKR